MTFKELAAEICKREGKKNQVNIAQVSEIIKCIQDLVAEKPVAFSSILLTKWNKQALKAQKPKAHVKKSSSKK